MDTLVDLTLVDNPWPTHTVSSSSVQPSCPGRPCTVAQVISALPSNNEDFQDADDIYDVNDFYIGHSTIESLHDDNDSMSQPFQPTGFLSGHDEAVIGSSNDFRDTPLEDGKVLSRLGPRLNEKMPFDDGALAFGTIRLYERSDKSSGTTTTYIRGCKYDDAYPNVIIKNARNRRTLRLDGLSIGTKLGITSLRVYILPQDVDSVNRGSVRDFHKLVKYLLNFVDCTVEAWTGDADPTGPIRTYPEPVYDGQESLFYIFNTLQSPNPDVASLKHDSHGAQAMLDALGDGITGIKTELFPHQKRSVAAMIQKEANPAKVKDPRKVKMLDLYGNTFYLDHNDGSLCRQLPLYSEPRGGILAETMGYGKTLICLAVILATRGHYPSIPYYCVGNQEEELHTQVPSLLTMAARRLKYEGLPWKNEFYVLKKSGFYYDRCVQELKKYERSYDEPVAGAMNPTRKGKPEYRNTVRLCSATLIIVPPNLAIQWQQEIAQHVDQDAVDVLVVDAPNAQVPPWQELIKYDIVLISKSRFEQEYRDDDLNQGKGIRYAEKYKSPLTEVRWLRVICDEGHSFAGSSSKTNAIAMLDKMFIERRWVVSGTPSSNLHGIDVSLASTVDETPSKSLIPFSSVLSRRREPVAQESEAKDLERLRLIVVNFLKLQPWSNKKGDDTADWRTYLAPRVNAEGKCHSMPALREVMQTLIIRHRIQDVECDLPALHTKIVHIEPSYYDKLSVNLFLMVLASNYVTSERQDEDYMFHPRNRGKLTTLINNLGHATFYWVGFTHQNVKDTLDVSTGYLDKNIDKVSDADGMLLTEAIMNGQRALADSGWLAFSTLHEMGIYITNFPGLAKQAWALDNVESEPLLLGTTQAREFQRQAQKLTQQGIADISLMLRTHGCKVMGAARTKAAEEQKLRENKKLTVEQKDIGAVDGPSKRAPTTSSSPTVIRARANSSKGARRGSLSEPASSDGLTDTLITGFASSKLTYLCNKLMSHPSEKSIIFYSHNNTAFFIAEALELLNIPFLIYANTLSVRQRAAYLAKFNSDSEIKVLLMDLKQAGQGLHVAAASRVYIVSPIWDPAIESQAIKRAHRIGQKREVFVETLVLKGTLEEALIARRTERTKQEQNGIRTHLNLRPTANEIGVSQTKTTKGSSAMLDDGVMVKVLKDIKFLKIADDEKKFALLTTPVPLTKQPTNRQQIGVEQDGEQNARKTSDSTDHANTKDMDAQGPSQDQLHSIFGQRTNNDGSDLPPSRRRPRSNVPLVEGLDNIAEAESPQKRVKFIEREDD